MQNLLFLLRVYAYPTGLVRAFALLIGLHIGNNGKTVSGKALLAYICSPGNSVALLQSIVDYLHQLLHRYIIELVRAPVVRHLKHKCGVERVVCVGCYANVVLCFKT